MPGGIADAASPALVISKALWGRSLPFGPGKVSVRPVSRPPIFFHRAARSSIQGPDPENHPHNEWKGADHHTVFDLLVHFGAPRRAGQKRPANLDLIRGRIGHIEPRGADDQILRGIDHQKSAA